MRHFVSYEEGLCRGARMYIAHLNVFNARELRDPSTDDHDGVSRVAGVKRRVRAGLGAFVP